MERPVGSILNLSDQEYAADLIRAGQVVGVFNRGVCALWFDGGNSQAINEVLRIKGERRLGRPISLTLSLEEFVPMIDFSVLPQSISDLLNDPNVKHRIGSLCFIRAPIKPEYHGKIPDQAKSLSEEGYCLIQNWDSFGHDATEAFLEEVRKRGVIHPAVTSMNTSGSPEIVDQLEGEEFCRENGIKFYLKDPDANPDHVGSYTIFSINQHGITLERDGNIPGRLFEHIFDIPIDTANYKPSKHPQLEFPEQLLQTLPPDKIRQAILMFVAGRSVDQIRHELDSQLVYV